MAGTSGSARGRRGAIVGINVTPMVDVMLVLLVIMMVSATYIVSKALKVELPHSASSDEAAQGPITVTIMGHSYHGAPILSMLNSEYEVSGTVNFTPALNRIYEVRGTLAADYSAVWIEEAATGRVMGKKIEIHH